jgi:hypothetical protein
MKGSSSSGIHNMDRALPRLLAWLLAATYFSSPSWGFFEPSYDVVFEESRVTPALTQKVVSRIAQDSSGAMWFATQEGLNRYDGREVEGYTARYSKEGALLEDSIKPQSIVGLVADDRGPSLGRHHNSAVF